MPGTGLNYFHGLSDETGTVTIPISQIKKQRLQEFKQLVQSCRTKLELQPKQPDLRAPTMLHQPKSPRASAAFGIWNVFRESTNRPLGHTHDETPFWQSIQKSWEWWRGAGAGWAKQIRKEEGKEQG